MLVLLVKALKIILKKGGGKECQPSKINLLVLSANQLTNFLLSLQMCSERALQAQNRCCIAWLTQDHVSISCEIEVGSGEEPFISSYLSGINECRSKASVRYWTNL